ncbi:MAG: DUF6580 family putative transport protein [Pseudohongiellaceae bacterium]
MQIDTHSLGKLKHWLVSQQALLFLIAIAAIGRLLPHPDNITPLAAIGLFAGAYLDKRLFLIVPIIAAIISDLAGPGFYNLGVMLFVYAGLLLSSLSGRLVLRNRAKFTNLPIAILASAIGFYLVSNLGPCGRHTQHSLRVAHLLCQRCRTWPDRLPVMPCTADSSTVQLAALFAQPPQSCLNRSASYSPGVVARIRPGRCTPCTGRTSR